MERRIKQTVALSEVTFDEEFYPRVGYNWQTGYDYSQSMQTGAVFPPITLALFNGKKILVDGKHRLEAHRILKRATIEAEVFVGWNAMKIFEEAVRRNIAHGKTLSPFEKRKIALKLRGLKMADKQISDLIQVPLEKLEKFVAQRLVNSITGEVITESIVKSEIKHLVGGTYTPSEVQSIEEMQKSMYSKTQITLLDSFIYLLSQKLLNIDDKRIASRIERIKQLLA